MARDGIAGLFNVNRSVTSLGSAARHFQTSIINPFPKLDQRVIRQSAGKAIPAGGTLAAGNLPEMVSDLLDESAVYAVENVKRERAGMHGLAGRVLGAGSQEVRL